MLPIGKNVTDFDELRVRNFPLDKKVRLMEQAKKQNKSLNAYLYDNLINLAERHEAITLDAKYAELQKETLLALRLNTEELKKLQDLIKYLIGE